MKAFFSFLRPSTSSSSISSFPASFWDSPYHEWIKEDSHLKKIIDSFLDMLPQDTIDHFINGTNLILLPSNGLYACTIQIQERASIIILFPDLLSLLRSGAPEYGMSILAHEIGHIILNHRTKNINFLQAQIEADDYVYKIGLGTELSKILEARSANNKECHIRLTYLTARILKKNLEGILLAS